MLSSYKIRSARLMNGGNTMNVYTAFFAITLLVFAVAILVGFSIYGSIAMRKTENRDFGFFMVILSDVLFFVIVTLLMVATIKTFGALSFASSLMVIMGTAGLTSTLIVGLLVDNRKP
jgi:hypothetical protein